jgi:PAS domain S-box-containing protein
MQSSSDAPLQSRVRLNALRESALPDSQPEEPFDRLTGLATKALRVPVSLVTLVDDERQFFKSNHGLPEPWALRSETPLTHSFAQHVVTSGEPLVVENTRSHPLVRSNPAVQELNVVAYAGVPLRTEESHVLGAFSVLDHVPRDWKPSEIDILQDLAELAMWEINQRIDHERVSPGQRQGAVPGQFRRLVEHSLAGFYLIQDNRFLYVNPKLAEIFGYTPEELLSGTWPTDLVAEKDRARVEKNIQRRLRGEAESLHYTFRGLRKDGRPIDVEVLGSRTVIRGKPAVIGTLLDITERKRAEEEIRRREAHFRSLLENASDGIHEVGADGRIRYISPSVERMLGYRSEELVGRPVQELMHPGDAPEVLRFLEEDMHRPGTARCLKLRLRHANGSWRDVEVQTKTVHDGSKEPVAIINTHDITEAKRIEQALRESEERYRLVARATNSAIRDWNVSSGACLWNGASNVLLRYTPEEIGSTVKWWYGRVHPDDRERVVNGIQGVLDGIGESWSEEYRFLRGDDVYATVLDCCHVARDERGIPVRVIGSLVDVTERKRGEEAQRFLAQASTLLSEDLNLEATLAALARLTLPTLADYCLIDLVEKREGEEVLRRVAFAHVDPTKEVIFRKNEHHTLDADPERHPVIRVVQSQEPVLVTECTGTVLETISHDADHRDKLQEMGLCSFMIVPLVAHSQILGVITLAAAESGRRYGPRDLLVAENLAHRAALAIEHAQLYRAAQEAIRAREEVVGVVSHDLRNPLNTIHLSAALLLDSAEERRSENVQSLERIRRASAQMAAMIEDLLDASSIDAGQFSVTPTRRDVAELVHEICDLLQPLCEEKSIALECVLEDGISEVNTDSRQIQRVFSNLVGNAIKFTPDGGTITIRGVQQEWDVRFSVSDTGPGIPPEQLPHVFDRYWQARDGDRRGAGLGLAIARGIVEAHGGRIWVESGAEGGTTFSFTLPAEQT